MVTDFVFECTLASFNSKKLYCPLFKLLYRFSEKLKLRSITFSYWLFYRAPTPPAQYLNSLNQKKRNWIELWVTHHLLAFSAVYSRTFDTYLLFHLKIPYYCFVYKVMFEIMKLGYWLNYGIYMHGSSFSFVSFSQSFDNTRLLKLLLNNTRAQ